MRQIFEHETCKALDLAVKLLRVSDLEAIGLNESHLKAAREHTSSILKEFAYLDLPMRKWSDVQLNDALESIYDEIRSHEIRSNFFNLSPDEVLEFAKEIDTIKAEIKHREDSRINCNRGEKILNSIKEE